MAYNSSKGPQTHGDVKYEGDAEDTQIDFENDFVAIKTNGVQRLIVNSNTVTSSVALSCSHGITGSTLDVGNYTTIIDATHISSSLPISASSVWVNGSELTSGGAVANYNQTGDNRIITSVDSDTIQGESALTFDGETLSVTGDLTASVGMVSAHIASTGHITASLGITGSAIHAGNFTTVIDTTHISSSLPVSASSVWVNGVQLTSGGAVANYNQTGDNRIITSVNSDTIQGEQNLTFDGETLTVTGDLTASVGMVSAHVGSTGHVTASLGITGSAIHAGNFTTVIDTTHVSSSLNISGAAFYGSGQYLTNLPSAAITTYNTSGDNRIITSVNSTTVQGESALTFDGETLTVTGDLTASVGMVSAHIASSGHISSSLGITGSALHAGNFTTVIDTTHVSSSLNVSASGFYGDGSGLTGLPSAAISTYSTSGDNRVITSVNSTTVQGESALTFDGETLSVTGDLTASVGMSTAHLASTGHITASLGITGSAFYAGYGIAVQAGTDFATAINGTHVSSSLPVSASSFWANGVQITGGGGAVANYNQTGDNRIITSVDSDTIQGESALTFDGETLSVTGDLTASVGMVSAHIASTGHITASSGITGSALHVGNFATVIDSNISGSGVLSINEVKCSGSVTAVSFVGDGSGLTNLPSAAITTYNTSGDNRIITSVNSTTVQGESALTFDGETLSVTGDLTASVGMSTPHVASTGHITASLGITGSAIHSSNGQLSLTMTDSGNPQIKASTNNLYIRHSANNKHVRIHLGDDAGTTKFQIRNNSDASVARVDSLGSYSGSLGLTGSSLLVANGTTEIDKTHFSSSLAVSASSFWANGVQLTAGGGGSPGGSDSQIQYNNGGSFGGEANFVYDDGNDRVGIGNSAPTHTLSVTGGVAFTGDLTVSGAIRATKTIEISRHYFQYGSNSTTFIPFGEGSTDDATTPQEKNQFIAPFSGRLKRAILRPANAQNGHVTASVYTGGAGVADFNAGGSIVQHVTQSAPSAATSYNINFSGSTNHFSAGEIVGLAIDFKNNPGNCNVTCIWEYNTTEDVLS